MKNNYFTLSFFSIISILCSVVLSVQEEKECILDKNSFKKFTESSLSLLREKGNDSDGNWIARLRKIRSLNSVFMEMLYHDKKTEIEENGDFGRMDAETFIEENEVFRQMNVETFLEDGLAVSPALAMLCMEDVNRTSKFIWGVRDAIFEKKSENEKRVIVLYGGCGPFAPLVLPLTSMFSPEELGIILLDIHDFSIDAVTSAIKKLCLEDYVVDIQVVDATKYKIPNDIEVDIIVSETMNSALVNEPQVQISRWLLQQAPNAILIPESVRIDLVLSNDISVVERPESYIKEMMVLNTRDFSQTVFELNKTTIQSWEGMQGNHLPGFSLSTNISIAYSEELKYITEIRIFGDIILKEGESTLTMPKDVHCLKGDRGGRITSFIYVLTEFPRLAGSCQQSFEEL